MPKDNKSKSCETPLALTFYQHKHRLWGMCGDESLPAPWTWVSGPCKTGHQGGKRNPGFITAVLSEISGCQQETALRSKSERKLKKNRPGREFTATNLRQDRQQEGNIRDYLKSLCSKHKAKKLPPKALLFSMWLSPSARCWLSSEIEVNCSSHCEDNSAAPAQACGRIRHLN